MALSIKPLQIKGFYYLFLAHSLAKIFGFLASYSMIDTCSMGVINMSTNSITNEQFARYGTPVGRANRISRVYFCLKVRGNSINPSTDQNVQRFVLKST